MMSFRMGCLPSDRVLSRTDACLGVSDDTGECRAALRHFPYEGQRGPSNSRRDGSASSSVFIEGALAGSPCGELIVLRRLVEAGAVIRLA
jgi:hypothetical protein